MTRFSSLGALGLVAVAVMSCSTNSGQEPNLNSALPAATESTPIVSNPPVSATSPTSTTSTQGTAAATHTAASAPAGSGEAPSPEGSGGASDGSAVTSTAGTSSIGPSSAVSSAGGSPATANSSTGGSSGVADGAGADAGADTDEIGAGETNADAGGQTPDPTPPRRLDVSATPARHEHRFRARDADSEVSYNDNEQIALFDNRAATLMGKLVLTFGGAGETKGNLTGGGEFCAQRGFHVLAVAAFQAYNIVDSGPDFFGDARRTVFEGVMHTRGDAFANIELVPADGVARRTQKALEYLHAINPEEDWGYYLQEDGSVRWSDVIFTGVSHGASNSARFAFLVEASRVVSIAGPRENLCTRVDLDDCGGVVATWLSETPKTPIERFFAITGVGDDQHTQHLFTMEMLGYSGEPTRIDGAQPPYGDSHRLVSSGGHDDFCAQQTYQAACNYAFGVPEENHAGTGP